MTSLWSYLKPGNGGYLQAFQGGPESTSDLHGFRDLAHAQLSDDLEYRMFDAYVAL